MDIRAKRAVEMAEIKADRPAARRPKLTPAEKEVRRLAQQVRRSAAAKSYPLDRRTMHQAYGHAMAELDRLWSFRETARKARHLDDVQFITQAIFHLKQSVAYMNILCRHHFGCNVEDLSAYK